MALPNDLRANVKLDCEECPNLDRLDQRTHQSLTTREARPLTVFLIPDDHVPFFSGSHFPPEPRRGRPAFRGLVSLLSRFYRGRRADIRVQNLELKTILETPNPPALRQLLVAEARMGVRAEGLRQMPHAHAGLAPAPLDLLQPPRGEASAVTGWRRQIPDRGHDGSGF